jgi:hypothetical protein
VCMPATVAGTPSQNLPGRLNRRLVGAEPAGGIARQLCP